MLAPLMSGTLVGAQCACTANSGPLLWLPLPMRKSRHIPVLVDAGAYTAGRSTHMRNYT